MAKQNPIQRPRFFWQGVLILLPVAVLAMVSLISLRRDERVAEQDARNRAAENAQSLARAVRLSVNDELHRFVKLQNDWTSFIGYQHGASMASLDGKLRADTEKWKQDYPALRLTEWSLSEGEISPDGRQIAPPERPVNSLTPPNGFWIFPRGKRTCGKICVRLPIPRISRPARRRFLTATPPGRLRWRLTT